MVPLWLAALLAAAAAAGPTLADTVALHRRADGIVRDPKQLQVDYDLLCAAGESLACRWRAWDDFGRAKDVDLARVADPLCTEEDPEACLLVAWASPGPTVEDRIGQLEGPCTAGVQRACSELGDVLARDPVARQAERDRAASLQRVACEAGVAIACRRAADTGEAAARDKAIALGDPAFLPPHQACDEGFVSACTALLPDVSGADEIALLERLCRMDDTHCAALLVARKSDPGVVSDGAITRVTWGEGAVLIGWDSGAWTPHARIELATVDPARLVADTGRHEHLELVVGDRVFVLPEGCDGVVAGARALVASGRPARAVKPDGNPTNSVCIDVLGPGRGPRYRAGLLTVTSTSGSSTGAAPVRDALAKRADALYDCAEADAPDDPRAVWKVSMLASRDGTVGKVKTEQSSGSAVLDTCFTEWLTQAQVGKRPEPLPFSVTVEVPY
jgi:hypothetical protein